jgi:uncharacterized protein (DUF779 family)
MMCTHMAGFLNANLDVCLGLVDSCYIVIGEKQYVQRRKSRPESGPLDMTGEMRTQEVAEHR